MPPLSPRHPAFPHERQVWLKFPHRLTLSGKVSKHVLTGSRQPNLEDLKRRMMSWRVAATTKYSCFSRSSLPSKNCKRGHHIHQSCSCHPHLAAKALEMLFSTPRGFPKGFTRLAPHQGKYGCFAYISDEDSSWRDSQGAWHPKQLPPGRTTEPVPSVLLLQGQHSSLSHGKILWRVFGQRILGFLQ